jgi:hypothetical protein
MWIKTQVDKMPTSNDPLFPQGIYHVISANPQLFEMLRKKAKLPGMFKISRHPENWDFQILLRNLLYNVWRNPDHSLQNDHIKQSE